MESRNNLFPIFLKVQKLHVLIIGAGAVGAEKLHFLLKSSPDAQVTVVAKEISKEAEEIIQRFSQVSFFKKGYGVEDLEGKDLVIAATENAETNKQIRDDAKRAKILVNVADTPELCDFYLGGIVTKGDLKIAISTNGKSPTFAKRLRQLLEEILPDDVQQLLENLNEYRSQLKGDLSRKVKALNQLTENMIRKQ